MAIKIDGQDISKRIIDGVEVSKVIVDGVQIRPESTPSVGRGIYRSSTLGLISISKDGTTWITIADKNLGASSVYNSGDSLTESNCGYFYQWGNNYGFSESNLSNIPKASTPVDATGYGPGNYYNSNLIACGYEPIYNPNNDMRGYYKYYTDYDYTWIQGPCSSGFHLPLPTDFSNLINYWDSLTGSSSDSNSFSSILKLPKRGDISANSTSNVRRNYSGTIGEYGGCYNGIFLYFYSTSIGTPVNRETKLISIRPFKNNPVIPDSSWTVLYQPSS